jgi:hypothetical protein
MFSFEPIYYRPLHNYAWVVDFLVFVIPAKAGIHTASSKINQVVRYSQSAMDSRLRGNDDWVSCAEVFTSQWRRILVVKY